MQSCQTCGAHIYATMVGELAMHIYATTCDNPGCVIAGAAAVCAQKQGQTIHRSEIHDKKRHEQKQKNKKYHTNQYLGRHERKKESLQIDTKLILYFQMRHLFCTLQNSCKKLYFCVKG